MQKIARIFNNLLFLMTKRQRAIAVALVLMMFGSAILECLGVSAVVPLISIIQDRGGAESNPVVQRFPFLAAFKYEHLVILLCSAIIAIYIAKNCYFVLLSWLSIKFSGKVQRDLSVHLLKSYMSCGYQFFLKHNTGYFLRGLETDIRNLAEALTLLLGLISDAIMCALISLFLVYTDWQMALSIFAVACFCVLLMYFVFRKHMKKTGEQFRAFSAAGMQIHTQVLQGIKDVLVLRKQRYFLDLHSENKAKLQKAIVKQHIGETSPIRLVEAIFITIVVSVIALKSIFTTNPAEFVAKLAAFALGAFRMLSAVGRLSSSSNGISLRLFSIDSLCDTIRESDQYSREHPEVNFEGDAPTPRKIDFEQSVELRNVTFRYDKDLDTVLKDVSLKIKKGSSVALIGSSGAGKSTLLDILLGLLIPEAGGVFMDGKDIRTFPQEWANIIGYIPQNVFLTDSSLRENIAFGVAEKDIDDALIEDVLRRTQLDGFAMSLPDGFYTEVGDRGVRLSGGQRQRIAIARALYHRPQIMVLDEATSALDTDTESAIMQAITSLRGEVTLVIVAHRLTTVRNCDEIYEVKGGTLVRREKSEVFG